MYMIGGPGWQRWYGQIAPLLLKQSKRESGGVFWPAGPSANAVWTTAVYTTILAMPNHYVPMYQR